MTKSEFEEKFEHVRACVNDMGNIFFDKDYNIKLEDRASLFAALYGVLDYILNKNDYSIAEFIVFIHKFVFISDEVLKPS